MHHPLPDHQVKRLQQVVRVGGSFVLGRYPTEADPQTLDWLNVTQRHLMFLLITTFKSLHDNNFPDYLGLDLHSVSSYNLRSSVALGISKPIRETCTFQDCASSLSKKLSERFVNRFDLFCNLISLDSLD